MKSMTILYERIKSYVLTKVFIFISLYLAGRSDFILTRLSLLALRITKRDHYKEKIVWIRDLFEQQHPSIKVVKKILIETDPRQREQLIKTFFVNQLLLGSNRRKKFSEQKDGFYPPGFMVISPTMKCNLKCFGCYAGSYRKDAELDFNVIDRILNEGKEMGIYFAVISGGEPFISKDMQKIYERHSDVAFHVYTNGSLIDEKLADKIAELGNILPAISVEGFKEETDVRRGKGHYEKVIEAMRLLKERKLLFGFSATQTRLNSDLITSDRFVDHFIQQGCVVGWYFMYVPVGREPNLQLFPLPEQRDHLRKRVSYIRHNKPILIGDFWNDGPVVDGCLAGGRKYFHINAQGDIEPCVFCHFALDNIKNKPLKEALNSSMFQRIRQTIRENPNKLRPCMIVDHPEVYREATSFDGVYFTHEGAEKVITDLAPDLDRYAADYGKIAEVVWEKEYNNGKN